MCSNCFLLYSWIFVNMFSDQDKLCICSWLGLGQVVLTGHLQRKWNVTSCLHSLLLKTLVIFVVVHWSSVEPVQAPNSHSGKSFIRWPYKVVNCEKQILIARTMNVCPSCLLLLSFICCLKWHWFFTQICYTFLKILELPSDVCPSLAP